MTVTHDQRGQAQVHAQELLIQLRDAGFSDEAVAVGMGNHLGGINPSAQSVQRWRAGKATPSRVNGMALAAFYKSIEFNQGGSNAS